MNEEHTAIHEAGHAVADYRHGRICERVSIIPDVCAGTLGRCTGEVNDTTSEAAASYVLGLLAGYAAVKVHGGYISENGTESDFEEAERTLRLWSLGTLNEWKKKAVEFMDRPENRAAVARLSAELIERKKLDGELAIIFIDISDGECTEDDLNRHLAFRTALGHK